MRDNITRADLDVLIEFLKQDDPILTQSKNVEAFEREWSEWLGVKHSVFVNSGSALRLRNRYASPRSPLRNDLNPGKLIRFAKV